MTFSRARRMNPMIRCRRPMSNSKVMFIVAAFVLLPFQVALSVQQTPGNSTSLYVGVAEMNITPPVGYGQYRGPRTGIKASLYAKAIVFQRGEEKAAIGVCDVIGITREFSTEVRLEVGRETDISYQNIIGSATHTHTGPVFHTDDGSVSNKPDTGYPLEEYVNRKWAGQLQAGDEASYEARLLQNTAEAVIAANDALEAVTIESGSGAAEGLSFNRRYVMSDGRVRFNPGVGNPHAIRPAGPVDPEIGILLFRRTEDNAATAGLINFANHTDTVGGSEYSADYPFYLASSLKTVFGDDFITIFGQGTSGNINHVDVLEASHQQGSGSVTRRIGRSIAEVVEMEIPNLQRSVNPRRAIRGEQIYVPLQQYTDEELTWALQEDNPESFYHQRSFLEFRRALKIRSLEKMQRTGEAIPPTAGSGPWTLPLEIQVLSLGEDVAIVGLPGEVFVELGLEIKAASPFRTTIILELTNRHIAYVPTEDAFDQGDYETVNSRLAPGGGELMVDSAIRQLNDLYQY